jgi:beta-mannosidase
MRNISYDLGDRKWRFRLDPENLGEHFAQQLDIPWQFDARWMSRGHDDRDWPQIDVPACWQAAGYAYNGVAWYRREFALPAALPPGGRAWLRFEGVDYFADVWLNEHFLGSHEGYFAAFQFEVTPYLRPGQNLLAVRVDSPNDICTKETQVGQLKGLLKGALQRWDVNNPEVNPGGIWNDVRLVVTGPGTITDLQVRPQVARPPRHPGTDEPVPATAVIGVSLAGPGSSAGVREAKLRVELSPAGFEGERAERAIPVRLAPGTGEW